MKCPVCDSELNTSRCSCGYDASRDYERYPTFGPVPTTASASGLRRRLAPKDALQCKKCGGNSFRYLLQEEKLLCTHCHSSFEIEMVKADLIIPPEPVLSEPLPTLDPFPSPKNTLMPAITAIAAGDSHTVALYADGTVRGIGHNYQHQLEVENWTDVVAISAFACVTLGLRRDGTVLYSGGESNFGYHRVQNWSGITAVAAGFWHNVGLRQDGTVVAVGINDRGQCNVQDWTDIVAIAAGWGHTVGLRKNGTIVIAGSGNSALDNAHNLMKLTSLASGNAHIVGLRKNGTVFAKGYNKDGPCNIGHWRGITAVAAGDYHTIGIKKDGSVVAVGWNRDGQCNVKTWSQIIAVAAGTRHTVGLRKDGTLVATGDNAAGQCDVHKLMR